MKRHGEAFVGIDTAKARNAVAVAEGGRDGEIRYLGEFDNTPDAVAKLVRKLADRYEVLHVCYEAGPTGYGLYRHVLALGHECMVVAPSLIPRRPGDRVKTNRRDALALARLLRAGELTAVWVPDETHEAVRDLVRTRAMAVEDYRRKRQHVTSFLLRHGRAYEAKASWKGRHLRWLDGQSFAHPAQRLAFQEMLNAVRATAERIGRLEAALIGVGAWTSLLACWRPRRYFPPMPFKHNAARRHCIPRARYRVTNWPVYEAGLRRRGDLTLWLDEAALAGWAAPRRSSPGGQPLYSELAIELVLTLRLVFHLALRQAEAFSRSVLRLLGLGLTAPDHSTLSRRGRAFAGRQPRVQIGTGPVHLVLDSTGLELFGQGEWDAEKHGRARRQWRKLHLAVDADTGEIAAHLLTDGHADDAAQVPALLGQAEGVIASITADGAYDGEPTYAAAAARQRHPPPDVVVPPRASAVPSSDGSGGGAQSPRDRHIQLMAERGRMGWQRETGYGRRNQAETAMSRYKHMIGPKLRARSLPAQQGEAAIAVAVLNTMIRTAKPVSVRVA